MSGLQTVTLQDAVMASLLVDVDAFKPGNVSRYAEGHGMVADDFVKSAELTCPILCDPSLSVGECVLEGVKITLSEVGCNTNLGLLMLLAPLIRAAQFGDRAIQSNLPSVLSRLDQKDTRCFFEAIKRANPGGLGGSKHYDIRGKIDAGTTIQRAMEAASKRDLIAKQYITNFNDIFSLGFSWIKSFMTRWNSVEWSAVACYINFVVRYPDTHIRRKFGLLKAEQIKAQSVPVARSFLEQKNPQDAFDALEHFDKALKAEGVNPGTSADLTVASVLVYYLIAE